MYLNNILICWALAGDSNMFNTVWMPKPTCRESWVVARTLQKSLVLSLFCVKFIFLNPALFAASFIETPLHTKHKQIVVGVQIEFLALPEERCWDARLLVCPDAQMNWRGIIQWDRQALVQEASPQWYMPQVLSILLPALQQWVFLHLTRVLNFCQQRHRLYPVFDIAAPWQVWRMVGEAVPNDFLPLPLDDIIPCETLRDCPLVGCKCSETLCARIGKGLEKCLVVNWFLIPIGDGIVCMCVFCAKCQCFEECPLKWYRLQAREGKPGISRLE